MARFQFSLRTLFALVALTAVACVALPHATRVWAASVFSLTVAVLVVAAFLAAFRRGADRAYWAGFAAVGWLYLLLVFGPALRETVGPALATELLLDELRERVQRRITDSSGMEEDDYSFLVNDVRHYSNFLPLAPHFNRVGHSIWSLLFALLGGLLARRLYQLEARLQPPINPP
jgi:hypothetical protein